MVLAPSNVSLRGLRTFCVAAKYENFTLAAEALFITPSAVSHQIKGLEQELGQQLFDRNNRDLTLSEAGRALYEEISPLIQQIGDVAAKYKTDGKRSVVRISVQPFFASEYFVPRLSEFNALHPEIDIQVGTSDESSEKHPADADLSIRLFQSPPKDLESYLLFPLRVSPAGSPAFKKSLKVKDNVIVSDFPMIVHESRPKAWAQWSAASGIELPASSKSTRLDSMIAVVRAAQRGIGAALVPVPIGELWFKEGSIVRLFDKDLIADVSYYLSCKPGAEDQAGVKALSGWIRENFADK